MTLTTKTRISNRKQIWRHNSWWNLLGKLPMEWVTCLQNLWVEQKKKQENKQQSTFIYNISFLGRTVLVGLFFDTCNLFKRFCLRGAKVCITPAGEPSHFLRYHALYNALFPFYYLNLFPVPFPLFTDFRFCIVNYFLDHPPRPCSP